MSDPSPSQLNAQVIHTLNSINVAVIGVAPAEAVGVSYEGLAHSVVLQMHNAAQVQFGSKQISNTAVAATCARIIKAGGSG